MHHAPRTHTTLRVSWDSSLKCILSRAVHQMGQCTRGAGPQPPHQPLNDATNACNHSTVHPASPHCPSASTVTVTRKPAGPKAVNPLPFQTGRAVCCSHTQTCTMCWQCRPARIQGLPAAHCWLLLPPAPPLSMLLRLRATCCPGGSGPTAAGTHAVAAGCRRRTKLDSQISWVARGLTRL
jgi:hypothetical protein